MHYSQDINVMVRQIIPIWLNFNKNGWYVPSNKIAKMLPWHQCQWLILVPALGYWQVTGSPYGGARYNFRVVRGRGGVAKLKVLSGAKVYGSWKLPSVWESVRFGIRKKTSNVDALKGSGDSVLEGIWQARFHKLVSGCPCDIFVATAGSRRGRGHLRQWTQPKT